ncbi:MAG: transglutaminase-like domain-containing protein [Chitinophagales bacterium]
MKDQLPNNELNALIHLLDDPDQEVYQHVTDKLISLGTSVIPTLENAWEKTFDPNLHNRLEQLIHLIQFENLLKDLSKWASRKSPSLLDGALMISRYQYPDQDTVNIKDFLERLADEISMEMSYHLPPLEQVNIFNHVLFTLKNFSGNTQNIHDPQNHFLKYVLESRKGNPTSLAIFYLILAEKIKMPVYGVVLPQHFVLSFHKDFLTESDSQAWIKNSILFYINPFNKGIIFNRDDITIFLKKLNITPKPTHYLPSSNKEIIVALIDSLMVSYELAGVQEKIKELNRIKDAIEGEDRAS